MPRSTKPWSSNNPDAMPPPRVRLRIFLAHNGTCGITGRPIAPQDKWHLDHAVALIDGGRNEEANLRPVLVDAHKAKTAEEVDRKKHVDARAKRHLGIRGARGPLAGPDASQRAEIKSARSADRRGDRLPQPGPRNLFEETRDDHHT